MQSELNEHVPTEEQLAREKMLEGIFVPHTRRRREQLFQSGKVPFQRFIHYTSAEAAINIINQKRLWLRNSVCMSALSGSPTWFCHFTTFFFRF